MFKPSTATTPTTSLPSNHRDRRDRRDRRSAAVTDWAQHKLSCEKARLIDGRYMQTY